MFFDAGGVTTLGQPYTRRGETGGALELMNGGFNLCGHALIGGEEREDTVSTDASDEFDPAFMVELNESGKDILLDGLEGIFLLTEAIEVELC